MSNMKIVSMIAEQARKTGTETKLELDAVTRDLYAALKAAFGERDQAIANAVKPLQTQIDQLRQDIEWLKLERPLKS